MTMANRLMDGSPFGGVAILCLQSDHTLRDNMGFMFTQEEIDEIRFFLDYTEMKINKAGVDVEKYNEQRIKAFFGDH